jgi:hypothetical protein
MNFKMVDELKSFLIELRKRDKMKCVFPDRMDRLEEVLGLILVKHGLGYGFSPQITAEEAIQILGVFHEGKESYREKHPEWFR